MNAHNLTKENTAWFRSKLLDWFARNGRDLPWRRSGCSTYELIVSEFLLQRTRVSAVANISPAFFDRWSSWKELATATEDDFRTYLQSLGLWRRRANTLVRLAAEMVRRDGRFPRTRKELETLPGVGQYIASAILLFEFGEPEPLLDVNMARVLERFFGPRKLADIRDDPYLQTLSREIVAGSDAVAVNWALLDHGALVCTTRNPKCWTCPLVTRCEYARRAKEMS